MILWACLLYFCITLVTLPILYNGYRFIFGDNKSGARWGIWCLMFGFLTFFIFNAIANYVITPELARKYLFLFIIVICIAIMVYNNLVYREDEEDEEEGKDGKDNNNNDNEKNENDED